MRNGRLVVVVVCVLLFASALYAQTGVNNAELNGNYAFNFSGFSGNTTVSSAFGAVGRFTADGAGNISAGELDTNIVGGGASALPFNGTYSIGADHRGVMTLSTGAKLAFAMLANGNAEFIEFDASGGSGTIGSGTMEKSDTTAYSTARINGDYAFGAAGFDNANNRAAIEGRLTSNGTGAFTNPAGDLNGYGTEYTLSFTAANYAVADTATGRGTMHLAFTFGGSPDSLNFVFYVVNAGKLFVMERDSVTTATPLFNGVVVQQHTPAGGFSDASLNGNSVIYLTGHSMCGSISGVPKAVAGLLTASGSGSLSLTYDENFCSAPNSVTGAPGMYSVSGNGRASITLGGYSLVAYLVDTNRIILYVSDSNVLFGFGEPQAAVSLANSDLTGTYAGFSTNPVSLAVVTFTGEFTADGSTPTGNITGSQDISTPSGPSPGTAFRATYSVSPSPTNGRGTMSVASGTGGTVVLYMISPSKFVGVSQTDSHPAILDFEMFSSAAASASLSSLSLNPTSVTGGNSSTGTVTLSGAAPSGGAQVTLSSSNTTVARVPASVTVAAGATSATFTVTTSAVSASTTISISAAYAGVTKSASLTVTPASAPPPTLSSLSLTPASVTGGNSSTGTVTLSAAAPSGGAQVTLSSSNTAVAQVPSSVTVASGATSATFTVSTSIVVSSTTVTISAVYGGVTRSASLTVTSPLPTLLSLSLSPSSVIGGAQSSKGTVNLSGPAPAAGAIISLSSSNGAADVPSSVTVAAGSNSASFPINTSIVLVSTSSAISASYRGTARTATLGVLL